MTALQAIRRGSKLYLVDPRNEQTFEEASTAFRERHPHRSVDRVLHWWGNWKLGDIDTATAHRYADTRRDSPSAADKELELVSAVVYEATGRKPFVGRRRLHRSTEVRHSRDVMPKDGDEIHALARTLLQDHRSQAIGWQLLLQCMTGLRSQEVLALRMDAGERQPGFVSDRHLYVRRAKSGRFPFVEIHPVLAACIEAHHRWHAGRSPWWLPCSDGDHTINRVALTHALARLSPRKITAHGCRAWFVTWQRSLGKSDAQVAALIGDRTVGLISSVYGDLPEVWVGGAALSPMPSGGGPAWEVVP